MHLSHGCHAQQQLLLDQLRQSDLAQRLTSGAISGSEPREYVSRARTLARPGAGRPRPRAPAAPSAGLAGLVSRPAARAVSQVLARVFILSGAPALFVAIWLLYFLLGQAGFDYWIAALLVGAWLMMIGMIVLSFLDEGQLLIRYLRGAWTAGEATAGAAAGGPAPSESPSQPKLSRESQLIVNQVQQDLSRGKTEISLLPFMLTMLGLFPVIMERTDSSIIIVLVILGPLVTSIGEWSCFDTYRSQIRARLDASTLAARIVAGACTAALIAACVPRPFGFLANFPSPPKHYADELREQLWRVAFNLDWYLDPPRRLLRGFWSALAAQLACSGILV